jgi:carbamate kinase
VRIVAALGGNALLKRGERSDAKLHQANTDRAAQTIASLAGQGHAIVVTHGNGPQVGLLALQSRSIGSGSGDPLDLLDAESEGMIGYLIEQALRNHLPGREVVALLTQVEVDPADPGFSNPTKPIGPLYDGTAARELETLLGWTMLPDGGRWRRVVPSPEPLRILELSAIRLLLDSGAIVICAGGGGIPVRALPSGWFHGVEAVIDKDLCSALLARKLGADALLLLTDVEAVYVDWGSPHALPIRSATPGTLRKLRFASGSMGPKVEAACRFVEAGGALAGIGSIKDAAAILEGRCGTLVRPE